MAIKDIGKGLKDSVQNAADAVKSKAKDVELPDLKKAGEKAKDSVLGAAGAIKAKAQDVELPDFKKMGEQASEKAKSVFRKKPARPEAAEGGPITQIPVKNALKVFYYLMAADGEIFHGEEEKFDAIGQDLDPEFDSHREQIVAECRGCLEQDAEPEDYYDVLQDGVEDALLSRDDGAGAFLTPKWLLWDLLTVAWSDGEYNEAERRLVKYVARKLEIDRAILLEMESSMLASMDIEREIEWIKTTDRPYLTIDETVRVLNGRNQVILESVADLIRL